MSRLRVDNVATEERGDILAVMPSGLVVLDVSLTHPSADSYVQAAAARAGAAAAARDRYKRQKYAAMTMHAATTFVPLTIESYRRLGTPAMVFLNKTRRRRPWGQHRRGAELRKQRSWEGLSGN